jgi:hypothetical protein
MMIDDKSFRRTVNTPVNPDAAIKILRNNLVGVTKLA